MDEQAAGLPKPARWGWQCLAIAAIFGLAVACLRFEGQPWWCRCGRPFLWSGNIQSEHNSQHLVDPYSFTHVLHGLIFYALLRPLSGKLGQKTRLVVALLVEVAWEVAENSDAVIDRYRRATISLGYSGDSVVNSLGDIASCWLGFYLASRLPARWSVALFLAVEVTLLAIYRDCLTLNVLMLVHPIESVKSWQTGH
jgi:Protein of unknown function (DUF2585)